MREETKKNSREIFFSGRARGQEGKRASFPMTAGNIVEENREPSEVAQRGKRGGKRAHTTQRHANKVSTIPPPSP